MEYLPRRIYYYPWVTILKRFWLTSLQIIDIIIKIKLIPKKYRDLFYEMIIKLAMSTAELNSRLLTDEFCRYDVLGNQINLNDKKFNDILWINKPKNNEELNERKTPYGLYLMRKYQRKTIKTQLLYDILLRKEEIKSKDTNQIFLWLANYTIKSFLFTEYNNDVPYLTDGYVIWNNVALYGFTREYENLIRKFENGLIKSHLDNTQLRESDVNNIPKYFKQNNPYNEDSMMSGNLSANRCISNYLFNTLFMRNHNRLCYEIKNVNNKLNDEDIFQLAKTLNMMSHMLIIFNKYKKEGSNSLYYHEILNDEIYNDKMKKMTWEANTLYQWHSLIPDYIGDIKTEDMSFKSSLFYSKSIVDWLNIGMRTKINKYCLHNTPEYLIESEIKNYSINNTIKTMSYVELCNLLKIGAPKNFFELCYNLDLANKLEYIYEDIKNVDINIGIMAENLLGEELFGYTLIRGLAITSINTLPKVYNKMKNYVRNVDGNLLNIEIIDDIDVLIKKNLSKDELRNLQYDYITYKFQP